MLLLEEYAVIGEPTHCTAIVSLETADFAKPARAGDLAAAAG